MFYKNSTSSSSSSSSLPSTSSLSSPVISRHTGSGSTGARRKLDLTTTATAAAMTSLAIVCVSWIAVGQEGDQKKTSRRQNNEGQDNALYR
jgi:hypothetical protein